MMALGTFLDSVAQYPQYSPLTPFSFTVRATICLAVSGAAPAAAIPEACTTGPSKVGFKGATWGIGLSWRVKAVSQA